MPFGKTFLGESHILRDLRWSIQGCSMCRGRHLLFGSPRASTPLTGHRPVFDAYVPVAQHDAGKRALSKSSGIFDPISSCLSLGLCREGALTLAFVKVKVVTKLPTKGSDGF